ncbi:MAG: endonuclease/exonuclease/phosphatase family protein [Phycisphaerae bacterium]|nr:endonuclease/exonuclease/phosphatase family protein [Phycisphaerae bacterium]
MLQFICPPTGGGVSDPRPGLSLATLAATVLLAPAAAPAAFYCPSGVGPTHAATAPNAIGDDADACTWVLRAQIVTQAGGGPIVSFGGRMNLAVTAGRVQTTVTDQTGASWLTDFDLVEGEWFSLIVRWDRTRVDGMRQEVRLRRSEQTPEIAVADIDASIATAPGAIVLGSTVDGGSATRLYDVGFYDRWLSETEVEAFEAFDLNVSELADGRQWAVAGGFDRQSGVAAAGDAGLADLAGGFPASSIAGTPIWDNDFPPEELAYDVIRIEPPLTSTSDAAVTVPDAIKLLSWNVSHWPGGRQFSQTIGPFGGRLPDRSNIARQLDAVLAVIDRERPAVLCLQEVYNLATAEYLRDQIELATGIRYPHVACSAFKFKNDGGPTSYEDEGGFEGDLDRLDHAGLHIETGDWAKIERGPYRYECAVLSLTPFTAAFELDLYEQIRVIPSAPRPRRGVLGVQIDLPEGPATIYVLHAEKKTPEQRHAVARLIRRDLAERELSPADDRIVICGDFNEDPYVAGAGTTDMFEIFEAAGFSNTWDDAEIPGRRQTYHFNTAVHGTLDAVLVSNGFGPRRAEIARGSDNPNTTVLTEGVDTIPEHDRNIGSDHSAVSVWLDNAGPRPAAPILVSPADAAEGIDSEMPVTLAWTPGAGVAPESYRVFLTYDLRKLEALDVTTMVAETTEPTATVEGLFYDATYHWAVIGDNAFGSGLSAFGTFGTLPCKTDCACPGDTDASGDVGFWDLVAVLTRWGPCVGCAEDIDGNDAVDFADLLLVLHNWGTCVGSAGG